jgi:hypothetical protein
MVGYPIQEPIKENPIKCCLFENYRFRVHNEVRSMHWHTMQVTILVHITYRWQLMQLHEVPMQVQEDP